MEPKKTELKSDEELPKQNPKHGDTELLMSLKKGDSKAHDSLCLLYRDKLLSYVVRIIKSVEETENIVQDVLMKIWTDRENIDEQKNFLSYIFSIAKNLSIDYLRRSSRFSKEEISTRYIIAKGISEEKLCEHKRYRILQKAVKHLPPRQKQIYKLHYKREKKLKDIATELNISLSAVKNTINDAIKNIRKYLEKNPI
jgi:RNA polymerase sigma-70 factor (ECF subfamily)